MDSRQRNRTKHSLTTFLASTETRLMRWQAVMESEERFSELAPAVMDVRYRLNHLREAVQIIKSVTLRGGRTLEKQKDCR